MFAAISLSMQLQPERLPVCVGGASTLKSTQVHICNRVLYGIIVHSLAGVSAHYCVLANRIYAH